MKQCSKCKEYKDESEFYKHIKCKDGLFSSCKKCNDKHNKQYYKSNKNKWTGYSKRQTDTKYHKQYYLKNKEKLLRQHYQWRENNKEKLEEYWQQPEVKERIRKYYKNYHKAHHKYIEPILINCKICNKEISTIQYHQKYCKNCKKKYRIKMNDAKRRNLKWKVLFDNPFDNQEEIDYHHINNIYVVPLPSDIHFCYIGYHTRYDNEDLDYTWHISII